MLKEVSRAREALHELPLEQALAEATRRMETAVRALPPDAQSDRETLARLVRQIGALLAGVEWELDLRARWLESHGAIEFDGYDRYQIVERTHKVITG